MDTEKRTKAANCRRQSLCTLGNLAAPQHQHGEDIGCNIQP